MASIIDTSLSPKKHSGSWKGWVVFNREILYLVCRADRREPAHRETGGAEERGANSGELGSEQGAVPDKTEVEGTVPSQRRGGGRAALR